MEIVNGTHLSQLDMTGDGLVDHADLDAWLLEAGLVKGYAGPILKGDANLDGVVDLRDFNIWNTSKFSPTASWCLGDFNANGLVDLSDFNIWNNNKSKRLIKSASYRLSSCPNSIHLIPTEPIRKPTERT